MSAILQSGKGDVFGPDVAADGNIPVFDGPSGKFIKDGGSAPSVFTAMPRGHLKGLHMDNNATDATNDIDIGEGECRDSTNSVDIKLPALITKRLDAAWVAGTNQGGRDMNNVPSLIDQTYHVFAIKNSSTGVCDVWITNQPLGSPPAMPSGFTYFRRIGSIKREAATIVNFDQNGDYFMRVAATDYNSVAARSQALLTLASQPTGIRVMPLFSAQLTMGTAGDAYMTIANANGFGTLFARVSAGLQRDFSTAPFLLTNTSAQIQLAVTITSGTVTECLIRTCGWIDRRGQDD